MTSNNNLNSHKFLSRVAMLTAVILTASCAGMGGGGGMDSICNFTPGSSMMPPGLSKANNMRLTSSRDEGSDSLNLAGPATLPYQARSSNEVMLPKDGAKLYGHY